MPVEFPLLGQPVTRNCDFCKRPAREGETFGPGDAQWDFTGICPECWNDVTAEPDDMAEDLEEVDAF